ncbi:hypothetical protein TBR22_A34000 [Luteitalea sp. TBR-22]|uniref:SPOR domain-containing protein n=1 Tax=Luteitalea sp. TBR-22 TaxID=2802971 RepID=UPI001AF679ED|nr:SPOR domain-containing protein [Luteitalea sp. TBR-22]BCS34171.1 hypothetical protein TBR22_A34000 [Luteitalea sp. TBR-22]
MGHDIHDDGFHEIQLSGKQLVFLFMATTVVSIVIFLCGVLVGRGVQRGRGGADTVAAEGVVAETVTPGPEEEASTAPSSEGPTQVSGLSYPQDLQKDGNPAPVKPGAASELAPAPAPAAEATRETPAAAPTPAAPPPAPPSRSAAAAAPVEPPPAPAEDGGFTVQVTALKNKPEADAIAQRLQARGYKAYVVAPSGGQTIFKVRVGRDLQRQDADKIMRRLQTEEKFKPWITR